MRWLERRPEGVVMARTPSGVRRDANRVGEAMAAMGAPGTIGRRSL
jgi:hypothetical protein